MESPGLKEAHCERAGGTTAESFQKGRKQTLTGGSNASGGCKQSVYTRLAEAALQCEKVLWGSFGWTEATRSYQDKQEWVEETHLEPRLLGFSQPPGQMIELNQQMWVRILICRGFINAAVCKTENKNNIILKGLNSPLKWHYFTSHLDCWVVSTRQQPWVILNWPYFCLGPPELFHWIRQQRHLDGNNQSVVHFKHFFLAALW